MSLPRRRAENTEFAAAKTIGRIEERPTLAKDIAGDTIFTNLVH
jgi:hypothetical protein